MSLLGRSSLLLLAGCAGRRSAGAMTSTFLGQRRSIHTQPLPPYRFERGVPGFLSPQALNTHFHDIAWPAYQKLNKMTASEDSFHFGISPEMLIQLTAEDRERAVLFNCASDAWNHTFFWNCMHVSGPRDPRNEISHELEAHLRIHFGSSERMITKFTDACLDLVGSGWVWVVSASAQLHVITTPNSASPVAFGPSVLPILALDMFEHSYVMDYGATRRGKVAYVKNFFSVVNWRFVEENIAFSQLDETDTDLVKRRPFDDIGPFWQRFRGD